jgi:hypothetical protein
LLSILTAILGIVSGVVQRKTLLGKACLVVSAAYLAFWLYAYVSALVLWIHNTFFQGGAGVTSAQPHLLLLPTSNF